MCRGGLNVAGSIDCLPYIYGQEDGRTEQSQEYIREYVLCNVFMYLHSIPLMRYSGGLRKNMEYRTENVADYD